MNKNIYKKAKTAGAYTELALKQLLPAAGGGAALGGVVALLKHLLRSKENPVPGVMPATILGEEAKRDKVKAKNKSKTLSDEIAKAEFKTAGDRLDPPAATFSGLFPSNPASVKDIPWRHIALGGTGVAAGVSTYALVRHLLNKMRLNRVKKERDEAVGDFEKALAKENKTGALRDSYIESDHLIKEASTAIDRLFVKGVQAAHIMANPSAFNKTAGDGGGGVGVDGGTILTAGSRAIDPKLLGLSILAAIGIPGVMALTKGYSDAPDKTKAKKLKEQKQQFVYNHLTHQPTVPIITSEL